MRTFAKAALGVVLGVSLAAALLLILECLALWLVRA